MIPNDPRVSDPASDKGNILNPRKLDIADEIAASVEMALVFLACTPNAFLVRHQRAFTLL